MDTVEKLELPLAHMIPELTANILIPVLMLLYMFVLDWRLALISLITDSHRAVLLYGDDEGL